MRYVEKKPVVVAEQLRDENDMAFIRFLLDNNIYFDYCHSFDTTPTQNPVTIYFHELDSDREVQRISKDVNITDYVVITYMPNKHKLIEVYTVTEFNKKYEVDSIED